MLTLALALSASFYIGTTEYGGAYGYGSVFKASNGHITTLYSFCPDGEGHCGDGANPIGSVVTLPDGSIVGTTSKGGYGAGTLFRLIRTPTGWQYQHIWNVCWVYGHCDDYGAPRGTLQFMKVNHRGEFILEGACENKKGRGVLYRLTITPADGERIVPLRYWH